MADAGSAVEQQAQFTLEDVHCTECADAVERALRAQPHITGVHVDWANNVVHVHYHSDMISPAAIEQVITSTGCGCTATADGTAHDHAVHAQPTRTRRFKRLQHAVDLQPITMGTKHDRMQYELPAVDARVGHPHQAPAAPAVDHAAMGHAMPEQTAPAPVDHAAMGHDMSDPSMAATMEHDMRNKFFLALLLTIPTVLYSPLGVNLLGIRLPTFGLDMNLIMLVLSTSVVWYCGWMFISGAYHSLRRGMLNMSVLIATGVLAAYVFSVLITFVGGETFFEAAAMLVTFVLFGHWMEMRSRRGTNEALHALFDLVPP